MRQTKPHHVSNYLSESDALSIVKNEQSTGVWRSAGQRSKAAPHSPRFGTWNKTRRVQRRQSSHKSRQNQSPLHKQLSFFIALRLVLHSIYDDSPIELPPAASPTLPSSVLLLLLPPTVPAHPSERPPICRLNASLLAYAFPHAGQMYGLLALWILRLCRSRSGNRLNRASQCGSSHANGFSDV